MRLLLTRASGQSERLAGLLHLQGHACVLSPLIRIVSLPASLPDGIGFQGVLLTSGNGAMALPNWISNRHLPVLCVGDRTAALAKSVGFTDVRSADGDVEDLCRLTCMSLDPTAGPLLHLSGVRTAGDLGGALSAKSFVVERRTAYRAEPAVALNPVAIRLLSRHALDGVLLFSPFSARVLLRLLRRSGLEQAATGMVAYCLGPGIADAAGSVPWHRIATASRPREADLLALLPDSSHKRYPDWYSPVGTGTGER